MARLRIQFIHGLEGSPQGAKARLLSRHFDALTPAMDTGDFEACVALQADALATFRPDVLVGSSFGAAVAVALLQRGLRADLPDGVPIWLVHGLRDELIDIEDSRLLAAAGAPEWVVLHEVDDDHRLHETVASGRLVQLVRELAASASTRR
jgi:hypothetical protein